MLWSPRCMSTRTPGSRRVVWSITTARELDEFVSQYPDPAEPPSNSYAWKYYERFRDETRAFSALIGVSPARFHLRADGIDADAVDGEYVVGNYFEMLGLTPAIGRLIG